MNGIDGRETAESRGTGAEDGRPLGVVVLTYPCETAARLVARLGASGIRVQAVVLERRGAARRVRRVQRIVGWRQTMLLAARKVRRILSRAPREEWRSDAYYARYAPEVGVVSDLNSRRCRDVLSRLKPDIAIIGEAGCLRPDIFSVPRFGTLNMHPGMLPEFRGLSSVRWAVYEGGQTGATLHFVDCGIDTGPIVSQRAVPPLPGDTFESLQRRIVDANLDMVVQALQRLSRDRFLPAVPQPTFAGKTYHAMPLELQRTAVQRLAAAAGLRPGSV